MWVILWLGLHHLLGKKFVMESASMASPSFIPLPTLVMDSTIDFLCLSECSICFCEVTFCF